MLQVQGPFSLGSGGLGQVRETNNLTVGRHGYPYPYRETKPFSLLTKFNLNSAIPNLKLLFELPFILTDIGKWVSLSSLKFS